MKLGIPILAVLSLSGLLVLTSSPARGQQASEAQTHEQHAAPIEQPGAHQAEMVRMMAEMKAMNQKLDDLARKMNAATGPAKVDAMAELLNGLVEDRRVMSERMMGHMMSMTDMMNMMGGRGGHAGTAPTPAPQK